jgi:hypothetical protein
VYSGADRAAGEAASAKLRLQLGKLLDDPAAEISVKELVQ